MCVSSIEDLAAALDAAGLVGSIGGATSASAPAASGALSDGMMKPSRRANDAGIRPPRADTSVKEG